MNIQLNCVDYPCGFRFLYRDLSGYLTEGTIREWSSTGKYLNLNGTWISVADTTHWTFVEQLTYDTAWKE